MGGSTFSQDGEDVIFVNPSHGKLINKKKNISWYKYDGDIIGIEVKDKEYEGHPYKQVQIKMRDSDYGNNEIIFVCTNLQSWYAFGFFQRADRIDVTQPITLGCSGPDDGGSISFCWIKQGGETIKKNPEFPKPEAKVEGERKVYDWSETNKRSLALIEKLQQDLKSAGVSNQEQDAPPPKPKNQTAEEAMNPDGVPTDQDEDLPF